METFELRSRRAREAWRTGRTHEAGGNLEAAYECFRTAHDLVVDCPRLHQAAHRHLRRINAKRRSYRGLATDMFLLGTAGIGSFELVALLMKGQVLGGRVCGRTASALRS